jgi:hypothetical protein
MPSRTCGLQASAAGREQKLMPWEWDGSGGAGPKECGLAGALVPAGSRLGPRLGAISLPVAVMP